MNVNRMNDSCLWMLLLHDIKRAQYIYPDHRLTWHENTSFCHKYDLRNDINPLNIYIYNMSACVWFFRVWINFPVKLIKCSMNIFQWRTFNIRIFMRIWFNYDSRDFIYIGYTIRHWHTWSYNLSPVFLLEIVRLVFVLKPRNRIDQSL